MPEGFAPKNIPESKMEPESSTTDEIKFDAEKFLGERKAMRKAEIETVKKGSLRPFGSKELGKIMTDRVQNESDEATKPFEDIRKNESKKWAETVIKEIGLNPNDPDYQAQMHILQEIYFDGKIEYMLSVEGVAEKYAGFVNKEDIGPEEMTGLQTGMFTEYVASIYLKDEFARQNDDVESSMLVMQMMNDYKKLPSYQSKEFNFKEKLANPDFVTTRETKQGNISITGIYEVKSSIEGLMRAEMRKSQFSNFIPHLKETISHLNSDLSLLPSYGIEWLEEGKRVNLTDNPKKVVILPKNEACDKTEIFEWQIMSLPFSNEQLSKLREYISNRGLVIAEYFERPFPVLSESKSVRKFNEVVGDDLEKVKNIVGDLDPIEFFSVLFFDKLPVNDEQKGLLESSGIIDLKKIMNEMTSYMKSHFDKLTGFDEQHRSQRFPSEIYRHFDNSLSLAFYRVRENMRQKLVSDLSRDQKKIWDATPRKSLESLLYTLRLKDNLDMQDVFRQKITEFFRPQQLKTEGGAMIQSESMSLKTSDNGSNNDEKISTVSQETQSQSEKRVHMFRSSMQSLYEKAKKILNLSEEQFYCILVLGKQPSLEFAKKLKPFINYDFVMDKMNKVVLQDTEKSSIEKIHPSFINLFSDRELAVKFLAFKTRCMKYLSGDMVKALSEIEKVNFREFVQRIASVQ